MDIYNYFFSDKKVFKLKDLQKLINIHTTDVSILNIIPVDANYELENRKSFLFINKNPFIKNVKSLKEHLQLSCITHHFLIRLNKDDIKLLNKFYPKK